MTADRHLAGDAGPAAEQPAAAGPRRPEVFTIPLHRAFADALAAGVMARHGPGKAAADDGLSLARGMILLPNNRAVTAVRDAFVRLAGGAILLPRLIALGDVDLDDAAGGALDRLDEDDPLPPAIEPMRRRLALARIIGEESPTLTASAALQLADALGAVIDQLGVEEVASARLFALGDTEAMLASHWEEAYGLLSRLLPRWEMALAAMGAIDRVDLRNRLLDRTAVRWRRLGLPTPFVIAAGITTSAPAVARLLRTIADQPGGSVVLSHVDCTMDEGQWQAIIGVDAAGDPAPASGQETHPQYHLALLLERMGIARAEVQAWPHRSPFDGPRSRDDFASLVMAPARFTQDWPDVAKARRALPGVVVAPCANQAEEALAIALAMREALETPGRTAALVTPDRTIATRVAGHLGRWGIVADDSAGEPLAMTPAGDLLLSLVAAAASGFAPVELLALLSHPLVQAGDERLRWLDRVRELDLALRGPRPAAGLTAIAAVAAKQQRRFPELADWWAGVGAQLAPLAAQVDPGRPAPLGNILASLRETLAVLAGDAVWANAPGRCLATLFADIERYASELPRDLAAAELIAMLRQLMKDVAVRPAQGGHPRLFIWGLIEARLQRADLMILAGLNEGQWPQVPAPDPWLAPLIRRRLGMPGLQRQIGLSSHDFASALGAAEVLLVRSLRKDSAPTIASRLLLRIDAFLGNPRALVPRKGHEWPAIAAAIDSCAAPAPALRASFNPPGDRRPKRISVTEVDTLLADPFGWYARAALGLADIDAIDADPTPAWRGTMVHDVLYAWLTGDVRTVETMRAQLAVALAQPGINPLLRTIWQPRLGAALDWAAATIIDGIANGRVPDVAASEKRATITVDGIGLTGKPDRIDRLPDGRIAIVDYKTGSPPAKGRVEALHALQLGLLAAMAEQGAFTARRASVATYEYWSMNKDDGQFGRVETPFLKQRGTVTADNFAALAWERFEQAAAQWLDGTAPFIAKRRPRYATFGTYDQLMRLEEWQAQDLLSGDAASTAVAP